MIALATLYGIVVGGIWRRVLGGGGGHRRSLVVATYPALVAPLLLFWPWQAYLAVVAVGALVWLPGHQWERWQTIVARYGLMGLWWRAVDWWWPRHWRVGRFIDGPFAVAEIGVGATYHGMLFLAAYLTSGAA